MCFLPLPNSHVTKNIVSLWVTTKLSWMWDPDHLISRKTWTGHCMEGLGNLKGKGCMQDQHSFLIKISLFSFKASIQASILIGGSGYCYLLYSSPPSWGDLSATAGLV